MTNKNKFQRLMLLLAFVLPACNISTVVPVSQSSSPLPTITHRIEASIVPSQTPRAKSTLLPPLTQGAHPTLTYDLQNEFYGILESNGNCKLPCFLNIEPGKTTLNDARAILQEFSINRPSGYDSNIDGIAYKLYSYSIETNKEIDLRVNTKLFVDENNLVRYVVVNMSVYRNNELVGDDLHLLRYSLREVFQKNGVPDAIYVSPVKKGVYPIYIVYGKDKIVIGLSGRAKEVLHDKYKICPNFGDGDVSEIQLFLSSPSNSKDVKTLVGYPFYENMVQLEKEIGLNTNDFYNLMRSDQRPACFQTN
jgi:hypothetical protein